MAKKKKSNADAIGFANEKKYTRGEKMEAFGLGVALTGILLAIRGRAKLNNAHDWYGLKEDADNRDEQIEKVRNFHNAFIEACDD